jgi:YidC/Oxa1 family membrane protein insertase
MGSLWNGILGILAKLLSACYAVVPNYMFAIALFTLVIMIMFTPLTIKSTRSMMAMQLIQPEMKALQAKYRDDRQTLNTEMMALYQRHGVNPLGGCLPLLVQMPIFFALFSLLRGLTRLNEAGTEFAPRHVGTGSHLFEDLSTAGAQMLSFGVDLSRQANEVVSDSLVTSVPYVGMVVVTGLTSWFQQRQMAARRTPGQEIPQQQQMLMKILPWTLPIFAFFMPAALVVYFIVSNLWRVAQQSYISRKIHKPAQNLSPSTPVETEVVGEIEPPKRRRIDNSTGGRGPRYPALDPSRPRPSPRSRQRPVRPSEGDNGQRTGKKTSDSAPKRRGAGSQSDKGRPAPTSRTAGHGPNKRPANKKKKKR